MVNSFHDSNILDFHSFIGNTPVVRKFVDVYKVWYSYLPHLPRLSRYTLGNKTDDLFIDGTEATFRATYASGKEKLDFIETAATKVDLIKFFVQVCWELKVLDNKKFVKLSEELIVISKMLNGWAGQVRKS